MFCHSRQYGNLGQQSQYCGRCKHCRAFTPHEDASLDVVDAATLSAALTITNTATGATAQAVVADACPGCATYHSLDLSTGLFQALGNLDQGIRKYCVQSPVLVTYVCSG